MKVLTVRQPWAWCLIHAHKDIENRSWQTPYRGPLLIQASARNPELPMLRDHIAERFQIVVPDALETGGIIGIVDLIDCVRSHPSRWFEGPVGWVVGNARALPFEPMRGRLCLFDPPADIAQRYAAINF